jgi:hypothetical protein
MEDGRCLSVFKLLVSLEHTLALYRWTNACAIKAYTQQQRLQLAASLGRARARSHAPSPLASMTINPAMLSPVSVSIVRPADTRSSNQKRKKVTNLPRKRLLHGNLGTTGAHMFRRRRLHVCSHNLPPLAAALRCAVPAARAPASASASTRSDPSTRSCWSKRTRKSCAARCH